ncbi:thiamine phosphate synthase, partial [Planktotalea sp.]|uniref:thiamine phosphate synthase n=1 Tax=Planktotalea sp. TaxID=2029877 RepID=UPI003298E9F6
MKLDRFYPIFDSADWIERLVPLGIKLVQIRIKDATPDVVVAHIERAKQVCAQYDCTLIINDYWQAAIETGCQYVHLGQ